MKISQVVTRKDAEDALAVLDALDRRLLSPEDDAIRGDFGDATINALRSALRSCWRVEDANADEDVDFGLWPPTPQIVGVTSGTFPRFDLTRDATQAGVPGTAR